MYICIYTFGGWNQKLPWVSSSEQALTQKKNLTHSGWKRSSNLYCSQKKKKPINFAQGRGGIHLELSPEQTSLFFEFGWISWKTWETLEQATTSQGMNRRRLGKEKGGSLNWRVFKPAWERSFSLLGCGWSRKVSWVLSLPPWASGLSPVSGSCVFIW